MQQKSQFKINTYIKSFLFFDETDLIKELAVGIFAKQLGANLRHFGLSHHMQSSF